MFEHEKNAAVSDSTRPCGAVRVRPVIEGLVADRIPPRRVVPALKKLRDHLHRERSGRVDLDAAEAGATPIRPLTGVPLSTDGDRDEYKSHCERGMRREISSEQREHQKRQQQQQRDGAEARLAEYQVLDRAQIARPRREIEHSLAAHQGALGLDAAVGEARADARVSLAVLDARRPALHAA